MLCYLHVVLKNLTYAPIMYWVSYLFGYLILCTLLLSTCLWIHFCAQKRYPPCLPQLLVAMTYPFSLYTEILCSHFWFMLLNKLDLPVRSPGLICLLTTNIISLHRGNKLWFTCYLIRRRHFPAEYAFF